MVRRNKEKKETPDGVELVNLRKRTTKSKRNSTRWRRVQEREQGILVVTASMGVTSDRKPQMEGKKNYSWGTSGVTHRGPNCRNSCLRGTGKLGKAQRKKVGVAIAKTKAGGSLHKREKKGHLVNAEYGKQHRGKRKASSQFDSFRNETRHEKGKRKRKGH